MGSVQVNVCVYTCLCVCARAQADTEVLAGVGSVAGLPCPLARGSGGYCGDHVCPGPFHSPFGPGPRLPACRPLEGVTGLALQVQGPGLPLTEKDGQSTAWQCGRGGRRGGCPRPWQLRGPCPQAQMTKLGEEMSLRFLKREARLCGFLQKSFLALEKVGA